MNITPPKIAFFAWFLCLVTRISAQERTANISTPTFTTTIKTNSITATAVKKASENEDSYVTIRYVMYEQYRKQNPGATSAQLQNYANVLNRDTPGQETSGWDFASKTIKAWKFGVDLIKAADAVSKSNIKLKAFSEIAEKVSPLVDRADKFVEGKLQIKREKMEAETRAAIEKSLSDPRAAAGLNVLAATDGSLVRAEHSADQAIAADPALRSNSVIVGLNDLRKETGSIKIQLSNLENIFQSQMGSMKDEMQGIRKDLVEIQADQQYIKTGIVSILKQQEAERKQKAHEAALQERQLAVDTVSRFVGFIDPKLGKQMQQIGSSALSIYNAASKLITAFTDKKNGGLGSLFSLNSAAATGDIIGGAMQIFGMFGPSSPSPEQLIMEQIAEVKQQIESLRVEMHERFDRVDAKLNEIMDTMVDRFNRIDFQNRRLIGSVEEIQKALVGLEAQLNHLDQNVYIYISDILLDYYKRQINGGLGFYDTTGTYLVYNPQFLGYENDFQYWATGLSKTESRANPGTPTFTDATLLAQLSNYPLLSNINFLCQFPAQRLGKPALANSPLANPMDWSTATRAYLTLMQENPGYATQINANRLNQIVAIGTELQAAVRNISQIGANANTPLFEELYGFYLAKIPAIESELDEALRDYYDGHTSINKLDIFAGADQSISGYQPVLSPANINFPGVGTLAADDSTLRRFRLPEPFVNAAYLGLSPAAFNLQVVRAEFIVSRTVAPTTWTDSFGLDLPDTRLGSGNRQYRYYRDSTTCGNIFFEVVLQWGDHILQQRQEVYGEYPAFIDRSYTNTNANITPQLTARIFTNDAYSGTGTFIRNSWNSMRGTFEANSEEIFPNEFERSQRTALQLQMAAQVQTILREKQVEFYENVRDARLAGSTDLRAAVNILTGTQKLWGAYASLGLSRAIQRDDYLTGLLYGTDGILRLDLIHGIYTDAIARLENGENVPKIQIGDIARERAKLLYGSIGDYLGMIQRGDYQESCALIEDTLNLIEIHKNTFFVPTLRPATGVIAQVRSQRYDRATNSYVVQFFVRNNGVENLPGPLTLAFDKQNSNAMLPAIADADGTALYTKAPFLYLNIGADDVFSVGESVTVNVAFAPGTVPRFTTRLMAGTGER